MKDSIANNVESRTMTRREALSGLAALLGGTVAVAELGPLAQMAMADTTASPRFLSAEQLALLGRIVDLMIPETETPGAFGVGVHRFIDMMLADYAAPESQEQILEGMEKISAAAASRHGRAFVELSNSEQFDVLDAVDRESFEDREASEAYRSLKSMILFGYYTTEVGASVELRFDPFPGTTPGCVPADTFDRAPFRSL